MTDAKAQLVQSWLTKAQHDLASARILASSDPPLLDTAIYHCQQAAEKAYARIYRYPGYATEPSREQFDQAEAAANGLYKFVLSLLPSEMRPE